MKGRTSCTLVLVALFLFAAGCTVREPGTATVTPTPVPPQVTPEPPSVRPEPTDSVPVQYRIELQVDRNTISADPSIIVTFRGGNGIALLGSLDVIVTRSDGVVKTGRLIRPAIGEKVELIGTTGSDRVLVIANMDNGKSYRVYDRLLPFRRGG